MRKQKNALESSTSEHTPFKYLTNQGANETQLAQQNGGANWYGILSATKKEEHLKRLRTTRQHKKNAAPAIG